ncbi:MAG: 50S ribosomal protein L6 [Leptospiraceae bacterium]|nr:50S ribosomal protein L6 [Leptospiraceae bacterium]
MSRIGNKPIELPAGVTITATADQVTIKGPKGTLQTPMFAGLKIDVAGNTAKVSRENDGKELRAKHGLLRSLVQNCVVGTTSGYSKVLVLQGVGYRAQKKGKDVVFSLGFSHDVVLKEPSDVVVDVLENTKLKVSGIDKQRVGQVAAQIRGFKEPEPYKGKGIRYENEHVRRKAGKAGSKK